MHVGKQLKVTRHEARHTSLDREALKQLNPKYDSVFAQRGESLLKNEFIVYNQAQCTVSVYGQNQTITMQTGTKKTTRQAVRLAATTLILAEGSTTTLDVKKHLRSRGYLAYQADISRLLFAVAQQEKWVVNDNGTFRVYYFPPLMALPPIMASRTKK